jgi:Nrap protein domain 6
MHVPLCVALRSSARCDASNGVHRWILRIAAPQSCSCAAVRGLGAHWDVPCRKARKTIPPQVLRHDVLVNVDPVGALMEQLEQRLGHCAVFHADAWGGTVIGIKWRPNAFVPGPLRVAIAHTQVPVPAADADSRETQYVVDEAAVIQEILHCGEGMVEDAILCT